MIYALVFVTGVIVGMALNTFLLAKQVDASRELVKSEEQ